MEIKRAEPQSLRAHGISPSLTVNDLQKSLAWYRDVLGFTVDQQYERDGRVTAVSLKAGSVRVLIGQDDGARGKDRKKGEGFSLMLTTNQDIDETANEILARGGVLDIPPTDMPWGPRMFRLRDPDGFIWTISSA